MRNTLNIIGAGKLGSVMGKLLKSRVQAVCNRSLPSAQSAINFIGQGDAVQTLEELPVAELTLLAVPDSQIEAVCQKWSQSSAAQPGTILFHASGALSSRILQAAADRGVFIASVHPLKSFADLQQATETFTGTFCAVEGDEEAIQVLWPLFEALGADLGRIDPHLKTSYHAACVMACGGLTALYATTEDLLKEAGIPQDKIRRFLSPYMKQTLDNNATLGPSQALTGPIARGDHQTVSQHQQALLHAEDEVQDLYRLLSELQKSLI